MAKFYGIGIGPGDSELVTIKAANTIKSLDILYTPKAHNDSLSTAEKIVEPYISDKTEIKRRRFPMIKNLEEKQNAWNIVAEEIIADVKAGNNVGFVTLGDASVYSTYTYLINIIGDQIPVETIAGIASYTQIAAQLSIPLMIDEEMLEVLPAIAPMDKISDAIDVNDNVVIMKISARVKEIHDMLTEKELLDKAVLVQSASMDEEKITPFSQIDPSKKLPYFSTLLIKKNYTF